MASSRNESNSNEVKQLLLWEKIPRDKTKNTAGEAAKIEGNIFCMHGKRSGYIFYI